MPIKLPLPSFHGTFIANTIFNKQFPLWYEGKHNTSACTTCSRCSDRIFWWNSSTVSHSWLPSSSIITLEAAVVQSSMQTPFSLPSLHTRLHMSALRNPPKTTSMSTTLRFLLHVRTHHLPAWGNGRQTPETLAFDGTQLLLLVTEQLLHVIRVELVVAIVPLSGPDVVLSHDRLLRQGLPVKIAHPGSPA